MARKADFVRGGCVRWDAREKFDFRNKGMTHSVMPQVYRIVYVNLRGWWRSRLRRGSCERLRGNHARKVRVKFIIRVTVFVVGHLRKKLG